MFGLSGLEGSEILSAWKADHEGSNFSCVEIHNSHGWYRVVEIGRSKVSLGHPEEGDIYLNCFASRGKAPGLVQLVRTSDLSVVLCHLCGGAGSVSAEATPDGVWFMVGSTAERVGLSASGIIIRADSVMPPAPSCFKDVP